MKSAKRRGAGLVLKFSLLMFVLVVVIVAGVSVPLMVSMIPRERRMLAEGLRNRASILLESVAVRAAEPIRAGVSGYAAVDAFTQEISAMPGEALVLTISGPGDPERPGAPAAEDPLDRDYLWATNDPSLGGTSFARAQAPVSDARLDRMKVRQIAQSVNDTAATRVSGSDGDAAAVATDLQKVAADEAAGHTGWEPAFDVDHLADDYLFYRPLVAPDANGAYFAGMVRLTVTTRVVRDKVTTAINSMMTWTGLAALIAVALGVVGAIILANIAITPIGRLVRAVSAIRETEDKSTLNQIPVGARDEIGTLSETVNGMIEGLVSAAIAEQEMLVGRSIQKQFLPLAAGAGGEKGSTGGERTADIDLYAYYEGAAKVSGDYFDWQKLNDRYYAIMKCDVSGHGVEAAFIMVEVATLFLRWCREWRSRLAAVTDPKEGEGAQRELLELGSLAYTINDMIEERGFGGKFAAFMLCLYDVKTGMVTACSAGDNVLYRHDAEAGRVETREIKPGNPAVGQIASDLIASASGYRSVQMQLKPRDTLILFTDGFEESKRVFRDATGKRIVCNDPAHVDKKLDARATHKTGLDYEEMSVPRILDIFSTFFNRGIYRLERCHLPNPETLEFDFHDCTDSLEEAVLALVSVERVYRTYRDPQTSSSDKITVETKVDNYLRKHFKQYELYFGKGGSGEPRVENIVISHLKEDVQEDDLTVLLVRRPK